MSLEKQLALNISVLPMEIIYIIKEFAFMHQTTAYIKNKKRELNRLFENAVYSRKNTSAWVSEQSETWLFAIYYDDLTHFQLESGNCAICGQYFMNNSPKLTCRCYRDNPMIMPEN
jgi:hypothetical protein